MGDQEEPNLGEQVLPMFRSRAQLHRWDAVTRYCSQAWTGVALLEQAEERDGAASVRPVAQKAIASVGRLLLHADDSGGSMGVIFNHLLKLHARLCREAPPAVGALVKWMIRFQFGNGQDFFLIDPVDYAPALGAKGLAKYQDELEQIAATIPAEPGEAEKRAAWKLRMEHPDAGDLLSQHAHARFVLQYNAERLSVAHRDAAGIIETHAGDQSRAYKLHNTARALSEIGATELAIDWAKRAAFLEDGHQAEQAGKYWCELLHEHRSGEELAARLAQFSRWPSSANAARLHLAAGVAWPSLQAEVLEKLAERPYDYIEFLLQTLQDVPLAWAEAHRLDLDSAAQWEDLVAAYQLYDPLAVLPVLERIIEASLTVADARNYKMAVRQLRQHHAIATAANRTADTAVLLASIRARNRNRPRLLRELAVLKY